MVLNRENATSVRFAALNISSRHMKTMMMFLAAVNALAFHYGTYHSVGKWDSDSTMPFGAKLAAAVSLGLWATVIMAGRLMAYNWFNKT